MDLSQVTLTQMRYAVAIEEAGTFREAATRCHVSQSGLSMQLHKLEELLGVVLFDRTRKPILVTEGGRPLLEQMRSILRETERLGQLAREGDEPAGPFRLGVIPTLSSAVLPLFLGRFVRQYPQVALEVEELTTERIIKQLRADTLDAAIAATPLDEAGLSENPIGYEAFLAYLPPRDPLLSRKALGQQDLSERDVWIMPEGHCFRTQVLSYCKKASSGGNLAGKMPLHFESGSFETLIRLVDDGLGATILPALVAAQLPKKRQDEQLRPLTSPVPVREIAVVTSRGELRRAVTEALVAVARTALDEALPGSSARRSVLSPVVAEDD